MKRFLIWSALCILLCLTLGVRGVDAQESKVDMTKWITVTVKEGANILLDFAAASGNVWVKVTDVEDEKEEKAPTGFNTQSEYKATGSALTIYGAIDWFNCSENEDNLTAIDLSKNVNLKGLYCYNNHLSSLDVSKNVNLTELSCQDNQLSSLDVSQNALLEKLWLYGNLFSPVPLTVSIASHQTKQGNREKELFIPFSKLEMTRKSWYSPVVKR